ncbi:hypothetical protein [Vulcanococcus limneticus]|uniref:hypothetical protein n=1 Tax=Vulcanococcus limneticus TaxID=2170428 RepID=UPI001E4D1086|nr:hypothetical protein [Vulcanococcus limneticus]
MPALPAPRGLARALELSALLSLALTPLALAPAARAQRVVPKLQAICPLGYVDMLNGKCSTLGLMRYTVTPTNGKACLEGWMNVGGGYCRRK